MQDNLRASDMTSKYNQLFLIEIFINWVRAMGLSLEYPNVITFKPEWHVGVFYIG